MIAHHAILLARGNSTRMNSSIHKLFYKIAIIATSGEHINAFGHGKAAQCFCLIQLKPSH